MRYLIRQPSTEVSRSDTPISRGNKARSDSKQTVGQMADEASGLNLAHSKPLPDHISDVPKKVSLTLPWPPSINHYYGRSKFGGVYIQGAGKKFRKDVSALIATMRLADTIPLRKSLCIIFTANPPDNRKRDLDNTLKAVQDSLQHAGVYENDFQIDDLRVVRGEIVPSGSVQVEITER